MNKVFSTLHQNLQSLTKTALLKSLLGVFIEIGLIVSWAFFVGKDYLDTNPNLVVHGKEWGMSIHTHYLWINFLKCGTCAFWNGSVNGGYPAFTELHGSPLHPIVMTATLIFGVIRGAEIAIIGAFAVAGIAQWWLAKELELGWASRLWVAFIAAAGGHITGRLELGSFQTAFSTAVCSLIIPAIVATAKGKRYGIPLLAVTGASAALSGSGYLQIGIVVGTAPAVLFLLFDNNLNIRSVWKKITLALGIALLLSAPLLIPWLNNAAIYIKDVDPNFPVSQPFTYIIFNLFTKEPDYYFLATFWKHNNPYLYTLFIGWIPIAFWCLGLFLSQKKDYRWIGFLIIGAISEIVISSAEFLKTIAKYFPPVTALRNPPLIAGLAVPFILGVSAIGLDRLLKLNWPHLTLSLKNTTLKQISARWLLIIPLLISLQSSYEFSQFWVYKSKPLPEVRDTIIELHTSSAQWVHTPYSEHWFIAPAIVEGLKLTRVWDTFRWEGYNNPNAYLSAERYYAPVIKDKEWLAEHYGVNIYRNNLAEYTYVISDDREKATCTASSQGGNIEVLCEDAPAGELMVKEKMWSGWKAAVDGEPTELINAQWLSVETPAGTHTYTFRFRPWDVPLGIGLSVIGLIACGWIYFKSPQTENSDT